MAKPTELTFSDDQTPTPENFSASGLTFAAEDNPAPAKPELTFSETDNAPLAVFDEGRGKTYETPAHLNTPQAVDQQIGVTQEGRSRADYMGLIDLGKDFAKGFAKSGVDMSQIPLQFMDMAGEVGKVTPVSDLGKSLLQLSDRFVSEHNLTPSDPESPFSKLMFDLGGGAGNIATVIGISVLAADTAVAAGVAFTYFGLQGMGQSYEKARGKGISPLQSMNLSAGEGALTGAINAVGLKYLSQAVRLGKSFAVVAAGVAEQAVEEFVDQGSQDVYERITGIDNKSVMQILKDAAYSAMIGGIIGAPGAKIMSGTIKNAHVKSLVELGVPEADASALIDIQTTKTLESPEYRAAATQLIKDQFSEEANPEAKRIQNLQEVGKQHDELAAKLQEDFAIEMGADAMKKKITEDLSRADTYIQERLKQASALVENTQAKGRAMELVKTSDSILAQVDALEAKKAELEAEAKKTNAVDKKIEALVAKHDAIDAQLGDLIGESAGLKDRMQQNRANNRIDRLTRRAESIVKEIDALEAGQKAVQEMQKQSDVKVTATIDKRLGELSEQYDQIDEELANLLHEQKVTKGFPRDNISLQNKDMDVLTSQIAKTMDEVQLRILRASETMDAKIDKAFAKLGSKVANIARINEKRRIHESLSLLRQIKNADIGGITIKERKAIAQLQAGLKALEGSPSLTQLRSFNDRIQLIKEEGKRKLADILDARKQKFEAQRDTILWALGVDPAAVKGRDQYVGPEELSLSDKRKIAFANERAATLMPMRLFEFMDGDKDGIFKNLFVTQVNRAYSTALYQEQEAIARLHEIMTSNQISFDELGATIQVPNSKPVTISQAMHIYSSLSNDLQLIAITNDNEFTKDNVLDIAAALAPKYKKAADELVAEMGKHAARLNVALLDYSDGKQDLVLSGPSYVPMYRKDNGTDVNLGAQQQVEEDNANRVYYRQMIAEQGFTKVRANRGDKSKLRPIQLGLVEVYSSHVASREHFISLGRAVKDLNALLADPRVNQALLKKYGKTVTKRVQDYVNTVASNSVVKAHKINGAIGDMLNQILREGRHAAAFVHLGYNIVSLLKVPVSISTALGQVSPVHMTVAIHAVTTNWKETSDFAYSRDPQLKAAEFSREQQEFRNPTAAIKERGGAAKIRAHAFDMMRLFDQATRVAVWTAAYNQHKELKLGETASVEFAQEVVLRTQPATMGKDLAGIFATNNELLNIVTQFTHQVNQNYGILTHDLPRAWKGGRKDQALLMALGVVLNALLEYAISSGRMPLEPEDWAQAEIQGALYMLPVVGPILNATYNGFKSLPPAVDLFVQKPWNAGKAAMDGDFGKALDNAFYFGAGFGKLPYTQIRRTLMGLSDLITGETDDYRRLIWSNYQLHHNEE